LFKVLTPATSVSPEGCAHQLDTSSLTSMQGSLASWQFAAALIFGSVGSYFVSIRCVATMLVTPSSIMHCSSVSATGFTSLHAFFVFAGTRSIRNHCSGQRAPDGRC